MIDSSHLKAKPFTEYASIEPLQISGNITPMGNGYFGSIYYRTETKTPMQLELENGTTLCGESIDLRVATDTLPKGKLWYHIRHSDDD